MDFVSLLFNMLSRLVIAFLPRNDHLLISWLQSPSAVILEPPKIKSLTVYILSPSISHEVMGPDAVILFFWMLSFKPTFSLSSFTFTKSLLSSSSLSAIRLVSSAYLRLLIFLPAILIPACVYPAQHFTWCSLHYKLNRQGDSIQPWCTLFPNLEPVHCSMFGSNCCFLTCIQIPEKAGKVVWYFPLFKNLSQFVVIHTVKGLHIINEEVEVFFWNSLVFSLIQRMLAIWSLVPLPFLNPAFISGSFWFM